MKIEILYFEGCPHHVPTVDLVRTVLEEMQLAADIEEIRIADPAEAQLRRFLGSPTVRIDGEDIEPSARERRDYGFSCRMYVGEGIPPRDMLERAIEDRVQAIAIDAEQPGGNASEVERAGG